MKKVLFASTVLVGVMASNTYAADIAPAPVIDWNGFYLGVNAGYGWGDTDISSTFERRELFEVVALAEDGHGGHGNAFSGLNADVDGFMGGVQAGFNYQSDSLLFGVVADFSLAGMDGDVSNGKTEHSHEEEVVEVDLLAENGHQGQGGPHAAFEVEYDWVSTVRARAGFLPTEHWLIYATGGLAIADISLDSKVDQGPWKDVSNSDTELGWTLGGGTEFMLTENITLFTEVLYMDFGSNDERWETERAEGKVSYDSDLWTVKAGVNFLFN
jgi:outer membrane immunogenic protein